MTDYEILLMFDPELPEERQTEIVTRAREAIEKDGGTWDNHEPWGRRRLAYEIDHKAEGAYHLLTFAAEPATLEEISRVLKITDGVIRYGAFRRVKGSTNTKAPSQIPVGAPASHSAPADDDTARRADDTDGPSE